MNFPWIKVQLYYQVNYLCKDLWSQIHRCQLSHFTTPDSLHLGNCELERVNVFKLLGVWFQDDLRWNHHIEEMTKKANKRLFLLRELSV